MEPAYSLAKRHPTSLKLRRIVLRSLGEGEHNLYVRTYPALLLGQAIKLLLAKGRG